MIGIVGHINDLAKRNEFRYRQTDRAMATIRRLLAQCADPRPVMNRMALLYQQRRLPRIDNLGPTYDYDDLLNEIVEQSTDQLFKKVLAWMRSNHYGKDYTEWFIDHYFDAEGDLHVMWDGACTLGRANLIIDLEVSEDVADAYADWSYESEDPSEPDSCQLAYDRLESAVKRCDYWRDIRSKLEEALNV